MPCPLPSCPVLSTCPSDYVWGFFSPEMKLKFSLPDLLAYCLTVSTDLLTSIGYCTWDFAAIVWVCWVNRTHTSVLKPFPNQCRSESAGKI